MHLLLVVITFFVIFYNFVRLKNKNIQFPACFFELPIIGSLYRFVGNTEDIMKAIVLAGDNTIRLGGISRVQGLNKCYLVLTDATDIAEVLKFYNNKDYLYTYLHDITGNASIFSLDSTSARMRRQLIMPAFTSKMLDSYTDIIAEESVRFSDVLGQFVDKGPICTESHLSAFGIKIIIKLANVEEFEDDVCVLTLCSEYNRAFRLSTERVFSYWTCFDFLYKFTKTRQEMKMLTKSFYQYTSRIQEIRRSKLTGKSTLTTTEKPALLDSLLTSKLDSKAISEEMLVLFGASEESSLAIGYTLMLLGQYQAVQDKVYEELLNTFGASDRQLVKDDLVKMPYLDMVIKESLRLFPPVPFIARRAHKEMQLSSGQIIPNGVGIAVPIISLHRNPKHWGPTAEHFDPDRFSPERQKEVHENAFLPFSHGSRGCPGYKLGFTIIKIGVSAILRKYKILDDPAPNPIPNIRTKFEISMRSINSVKIQLAKRN